MTSRLPLGTTTDSVADVLELLLQPSPRSGTTDAIAEDAHLPPEEARKVLLGLERRRPPLVQRPGPDATPDDNSWTTTPQAADVWREHCNL